MAQRSDYSIRRRLALFAACLLLLFLVVGGVVLDKLFRDASERAMVQRLETAVYALLSDLEVDKQGVVIPPSEPPLPDLARQSSGLYAWVHQGGLASWKAPSLLGIEPPENASNEIGEWQQRRVVVSGNEWIVVEYAVEMESEVSTDVVGVFTVTVAEDLADYQLLVTAFRRDLSLGFGVVTVVFSLLFILLLRRGLRPLADVAHAVRRVERGKAACVEGEYPAELTGLVDNLNRLLAASEGQLERYRNALGDLSHSLKTPLAVIRGEIARDSDLYAQTEGMQRAIDYHLERAAAAGSRHLAPPLQVRPVVQKIVNTLGKLYPECSISNDVCEELMLRIDQADLLEILGNLIENACKYGAGQVEVRAITEEGAGIMIADNGAGFASMELTKEIARGRRGDSTVSGHTSSQGLGLALCKEIVTACGGEMMFGLDSELGGATVSVKFP